MPLEEMTMSRGWSAAVGKKYANTERKMCIVREQILGGRSLGAKEFLKLGRPPNNVLILLV